jgi:hypothetical protein
MDKKELQVFIDATMSNRSAPYRWVRIGELIKETQIYIEHKLGAKLKYINTDNSGVIHALRKPAHNLKPDDLLYASNVINVSDNITLSPKTHNSCPVLIFKHDIGGGELTILAEVHAKDGYLLVFDAWREKKAQRNTTANMPSANVQNASLSADTSLSP